MRFNKLDLNLLVALDALLTETGISRAAERMHMSQSAMSNALARLRDYFDDPLLVQVGRKMELTPRAETLRMSVHDLLMRVDMTIAAQPEFDPSTSDREFRILVSDYTLTTLMPHLLALAHKQSRSVRFALLRQIEQPQHALERSEADILVYPMPYCSPDHPVETLWREEFVCVVCNQSTHARQPLTFERYVASGHVLMQPPDAQPSFESWFLQRYGVARRVEVATFSFASIPALVVHTERIATVHRRLAELAAKSLPIMLLPPPISFPAMEQGLQWHKYRTLDPGLVWLRGLLHRAVERMDGASPVAGHPSGLSTRSG